MTDVKHSPAGQDGPDAAEAARRAAAAKQWMGIIVSTVGFIQFLIVPRMLARAFATPKDKP